MCPHFSKLDPKNISIHLQRMSVQKENRILKNGHKPCVVWLTGLSGSGKTSTADALEKKLYALGYKTYALDGDNVRHGLNKDLGFSNADRVENIRRIGEVSKLFTEAGLIVLSAFISPFASDRQLVRNLFEQGEFIEVFMDTPLNTCEARDPKGLYKKARTGAIKHFTGIDSPYEKPEAPEIAINTSKVSVEECIEMLLEYLKSHELIATNHKN